MSIRLQWTRERCVLTLADAYCSATQYPNPRHKRKIVYFFHSPICGATTMWRMKMCKAIIWLNISACILPICTGKMMSEIVWIHGKGKRANSLDSYCEIQYIFIYFRVVCVGCEWGNGKGFIRCSNCWLYNLYSKSDAMLELEIAWNTQERS